MSKLVAISDKERPLIEQLRKQASIRLADERFNNQTLRTNVINSLAYAIYGAIYNIDSSCDVNIITEAFKGNSSDKDVQFCLGLSSALIMGYYQSLNTDRVVKEEDIKEFGFDGLSSLFDLTFICELGELLGDDNVDINIESGLHIKMRNVSVEEYINNAFYMDDLKVLNDILLANIDDGYNKTVLDSVGIIFKSEIKAGLADLESVYRVLFEDSFGIHPYEGVYTDNGFYRVNDETKQANKITEGITVLKELGDRIGKRLSGKVTVSNKRQFDYDEIYGTKSLVYFPFKILEYASGRESSLNMIAKQYRASANGADWGTYWKNYLSDNIEKILTRGYYKALEYILLSNKSIDSDFSSQKYLTLTNEKIQEWALSNLDEIKKKVVKLLNSMRCAYLLTSYPVIAGEITAIHLRFSDLESYSCFDKTHNAYLFRNLLGSNDNEVFLDAYCLNEGEKSGVGKVLSATVYEYQYDINPMLAQAEPLFGYTIQKQNQKKGRKASWKRILIGESMSGKELYAAPDSQIKLQNAFVHNIIAGSRSGKGVMTMNILASAIADDKPIFYLDRKPDMASMLFKLSGGKQFIVNGGLYQSNFDTSGVFCEGGAALQGWEKTQSYIQQNPWIGELFLTPSGQYTNTILGDYIYFRATMFCLGLCVLRSMLKDDDPLLSEFNGKDGIVIVFDEITGFQNNISTLLSSITSPIVQKAALVGDTDALLRKRDELTRQIEIEQIKISEAKKDSQIAQSEAKIEKIKSDLNALVDKQAVYAATFFDKIRQNYSTLKSQKVAGFKNREFNYSDIFVLGQDLKPPYYSSGGEYSSKGSVSPVFFPLKSDKSDYYANYKGADIVRSFLEELGESDWFLGRNPQYMYGDKSYNETARKVCDDDGNWEYITGSNSCYNITGVEQKELHSILFKPYLVLNNNKESFSDTSGLFQYVAQCADRVNKTAGGMDLWHDVRIKHLTSDAKSRYSETNRQEDCLDPGVGFQGLIEYTLGTNPERSVGCDISRYIEETLAKSGRLADKVAIAMGYTNWKDLLFDLSPNGLFSFNDMYNAVCNPSAYTVESRLPIYAKLGLLSNETDYDAESVIDDYDLSEASWGSSEDIDSYDSDDTQSYDSASEESFEEQEDYTPENDETGFFSDNYEDDEEDYDDYNEDESSVSNNQHTQVQDDLKIMDTNEFCNWVTSEAYKVGITSAEGVLMLINKCMNYIKSQGILLG